jgi:4-amino-4-deoxy-L-arabinose transferase-like glycosyltransferase
MIDETMRDRARRDAGWSARRFAIALTAVVLLGLALRSAYPLADPAWRSSAGVVWHDEGAWTHNARNRALFGEWKLDEWNPMYVAPVFTGLEYASFRAFGVGLWQARLVSGAMGLLAVLLLGLGVARIGGRLAGLIAAALLATNFVSVSYDRAALMESTMVALVVAAWYSYGRAAVSARWGLAAGLAAVLAYFTKASAVFFLAAIGLDALLAIAVEGRGDRPVRAAERRAAIYTLAGLAGAGLLSLAAFVGPNWRDYVFYNWQISVTRKPSYTLRAVVDRASGLPVIHDFFTRMWGATVLALAGAIGVAHRWRRVAAAERLLVLWIVLGTAELVLHDVGNERRLVFLVPALVALAAIVLGRERRVVDEAAADATRGQAWCLAPALLAGLYVIAGALVRVPFLDEIHAGVYRSAVRLSAAAALAVGVAALATWPRIPRAMARVGWSPAVAAALAAILLGTDLWQLGEWASARTYKNYEAMVAVSRWLPPGTLVQGKLANGLDLESAIKPVFVGRGFGNYADRANRPDIRYLLTYTYPSLGYESQAGNPVVKDILDACPGWRVVREFPVAESPGGRDRAALIDKYPDRAR